MRNGSLSGLWISTASSRLAAQLKVMMRVSISSTRTLLTFVSGLDQSSCELWSEIKKSFQINLNGLKENPTKWLEFDDLIFHKDFSWEESDGRLAGTRGRRTWPGSVGPICGRKSQLLASSRFYLLSDLASGIISTSFSSPLTAVCIQSDVIGFGSRDRRDNIYDVYLAS